MPMALASQPVSATWVSDISVSNAPTAGSAAPLNGVYTDANGLYTYNGMRMPAIWNFSWVPTKTCYDQSAPPYNALTPPLTDNNVSLFPGISSWSFDSDLEFDWSSAPPPNAVALTCYVNSPNNPDFTVGDVSPAFVLDDAYPSSVQVTSMDPLMAAPSATQLTLYSTSLSVASTVTATSIASDGMSATFPYPHVAAGAYISAIVSNPPGQRPSTDGMEPFFIGHDDTSFTTAFSVTEAQSPNIQYTFSGAADIYGDGTCAGQPYSETSNPASGPAMPIVTLLTQGQIAVGNSSNTIAVGTSPTVVVPFNDMPYSDYIQRDPCDMIEKDYSGAQSALVVNTGSNNISIVSLGGDSDYPTGTVAVGNQPVAASISSDESTGYIANYADGTISVVDLVNLQVTRTITVMPHPTALSLDSSGNVWVGGQGSVERINANTRAVDSTIQIDGSVNSMVFDTKRNVLVQSLLQNGSAQAQSDGGTHANLISFNDPSNPSYSTMNTVNTATGSSSTSSIVVDNGVFGQSTAAPYLAFPAQTSFVPPVIAGTNDEITATATGNSFTISLVGSGKVLLTGTVPYPIRSIALGGGMLYFTMTESNSLVSLPVVLP